MKTKKKKILTEKRLSKSTAILPVLSKGRTFKGIPVSPGIAIGTAHIFEQSIDQFPRYWISDREIPSEIRRFKQALNISHHQLFQIQRKICKFERADHSRILETHQMLTKDEMLTGATMDLIQQEHINAEWALDKALSKLKTNFSNIKNDLFRERGFDIEHVRTAFSKEIVLYIGEICFQLGQGLIKGPFSINMFLLNKVHGGTRQHFILGEHLVGF